jgi:hypothetical protein
MGVKINVGYCQKIGLPNYGSEGAHCNLEIEVDSGLLNNTEAFQRRVQEVYAACRVAVETQLQCDTQTSRTPAKQEPQQSCSREPALCDTKSHSTHRNGAAQTSTASPKQSKYAEQLAAQVKGFGVQRLDNLCVRMYQKSFAALSGIEASNLIDTLREAKAGRLDLTAV